MLQYWGTHGKKKEHPLYKALQACRHRAKKKGIECTIRLEDFVVPDVCPVLGIPLDSSDFDHRPSVDRVDPTKGYVLDNCKVISMRANRIKNDATPDEIAKVLEYARKFA